MNTELTKAAQQALEVLKSATSFMSKKARDQHPKTVARLERALTQRPAAQEVAAVKTLETLGYTYHGGELWKPPLGKRPAALTEREAFEARVVAEAGEGAIAKWLGTDGYENTRVQDYRLGWVWCLEWQARASLPTQPAAQATHETVKFSHAGHFYNLVAHALMEVKRPDACAHRLRLILDELAVLMGQSATPPQQAAGEPVGEPFKVEQCMQVASDEFDAFLIGGCKGEPPRMSMAFASTLFKTIIRERGMFFTATHPAPGVPEGAREALERIASWNEHPAMLGVDYGSNGVRDYYRKIASDALAAAQAKGADPEDLAAAGVMLMGRRADHA